MKNAASFDGIHREAADQTAAKVFAGGEHYFNPIHVACAHWEVQPPIKKTPSITLDLTGRKFGRFTVIGLHLTKNGCWVVRCSCGDFETRKAKAINNPNNFGDRCTKCRRLVFELNRDHYNRTGKDMDRAKLLNR